MDRYFTRLQGDKSLAALLSRCPNLQQLRAEEVGFLSLVFGAPVRTAGRSLGPAHKSLQASQLFGDAQFDTMAGHLRKALSAVPQMPSEVVDEAMAVIEATRDLVLGRAE